VLRKRHSRAGFVALLIAGLVGVGCGEDAEPRENAQAREQAERGREAADRATRDSDGDGTLDTFDFAPDDADVQRAEDVEETELDDAPAEDDPFAEPEPEQRPVSVGEAGVDDDVTFKVNAMERVDSIAGGEFSDGPITPREGAQLIRVDLTYKNNMQAPIDLLCGGGQGFVLLDEDDRNYEPVNDLTDIAENGEVCLEEVQPGFKSDVVLAFQMPRRAEIGGLVVWNPEAEDDYDGTASQLIFLPRS